MPVKSSMLAAGLVAVRPSHRIRAPVVVRCVIVTCILFDQHKSALLTGQNLFRLLGSPNLPKRCPIVINAGLSSLIMAV